MKDKQGQVFSIWLVFITMMMIGTVIALFYLQQQNVQSLVVSPMNILNERDALEIFEMKEFALIANSLEISTGNFGSDQFYDSFHNNFVDGVWDDEEMKKFLFSNLSIDEVEIRDRDKNRNLIENGIYPKVESEFNETDLVFARIPISKNYLIKNNDEKKNNFPLGFSFEFERKYLITMFEDKYSVRKL